jgi:hypothetical protein
VPAGRARLRARRHARQAADPVRADLLARGAAVAVEVFDFKTHDDKTLATALERIKRRFGIERVVVCGDRGMVTEAKIELLREHGVDWITALKAPQVQALIEAGELQLSLFDETNLAEITAEAYPGERLVVCRNPHVARERARKREALLAATEKELQKGKAAVDNPRGRLHGQAGRADRPSRRQD